MAKLRILTDDELIETLRDQFNEARERLDKVKVELEASRGIYQGISKYSAGGLDTGLLTNYLFQQPDESTTEMAMEGLDLTKAILFLHSKMCISDPVVTATPLNSDPSNKRAAECAQLYIPYYRKHTEMQEVMEAGVYLNTVVDGNGVLFTGWDTDGGEMPINDNPEDIKMEGDYDLRSVMVDRFYIDASAMMFKDADHVFEEMDVPTDRLLFKYGEKPEVVEQILTHRRQMEAQMNSSDKRPKNTVKVYEYWLRGRPWNGFEGMRVVFIDPANPKILERGPNPLKHKKLPYSMLTDIDIPGNPYGMSRIVYAYQVQKGIDMLISMIMDNIQLHGVAKFMYPEGSISDDALKNSADLGIPFNPSTGGKIDWFRPAQVTADVWKAYDIMKGYINNIFGMNEFSQGQIPRELSSYAVQLAMEMDDKYRIRLFNKKKNFLRDAYVKGLEVTKQYMTEVRKLSIVGVEGFKDSEYFSSTKLVGDYDLDVDYGQYIPVDPAARKQQMLEFVKSGFFEKAGGNMKKLATLLVDGSMLDLKNTLEASYKRQQKEIDQIIKGDNVAVEKWDDDAAHLEAINDYTTTETFEVLPREIQDAIWAHGEEHTTKLATQLAQQGPQAGAAPGAPGGAPGGMPPPPGGAPGGMPPPPGEVKPPAPPAPGAVPTPGLV